KLLTDRSLIKKRLRVTAAGYGPTRQDKKAKVQVLRKFETVTVSGIGTVTGQTLLRETHSHGTIPGDSGGPIFTEVNGELFLWAVNSNGTVGEPGRVEPTVRHLDWIAKASADLDGSPIENPRLDFSAPTPTPTPTPSPAASPNPTESSNVTQ
ncbi:MAG: trypsin-like serine protease, partial [Proteobacteria bacterium]